MIKSPRQQSILDIIQDNPGIQFRELMRRMCMKNGTLSYHLHTIERSGAVTVDRYSRRTHYYPVGLSETEKSICKYLRRATPRCIILVLMQNPEGLSFYKIASLTGKSPSTVSVCLSHLVGDSIVKKRLSYRKAIYQIYDRQTVDRLVDEYHPGILDNSASAMEDIFSSL